MIAAAGLRHPSDIKAHHLAQRVNDREIKNYAQLHFFLKEGELLQSELKMMMIIFIIVCGIWLMPIILIHTNLII